MSATQKTIIITGASSGLGAALAEKYSLFGHKLFLIARSKERLEKVAKKCRSNGANVNIIVLDITDYHESNKALTSILKNNNIDIVIACAGVSAGTLQGPEKIDQIRKIFSTNTDGVINTITPVIPKMIKRGTGNIVIISSMAGLLGLSSAPSYSASKGAIRIFADALRGYLSKFNVHVTTVIPGYIKTPMTEVNNFPMPFMITAEKAANKIILAIEKNKSVVAFPLVMYLIMKLISIFPMWIWNFINSKLPGKPPFHDYE
ncbi:MAG: SDR family NAD(P)-dependent oxidoreductase [Rickettsiales bacterium]|nr:SDR family NAD(P)-dependent oxidoreductase [Rickettsiales bacterium]MCA0254186.1 SDR family NAD(P)-dependent oxidoreductase [Pseudomonadota bacterium]